MPFYEIRYKKVKDGVKKRYTVAPIFEKAVLKTQLPFDEEAVVKDIEELAETEKELREKLATAFFNIMNYGYLGVDKLDRFEPITDEDRCALRTLIDSIKEWTDRAESYLSALDFAEGEV